ncbi:hypothetical protein RB195_025558 [Necator americanus]|uniref:Uncharacterized protein n=1 Tax=Necator americanus TaxID=51031 RepID=A0ABR1ETH4_NECAM
MLFLLLVPIKKFETLAAIGNYLQGFQTSSCSKNYLEVDDRQNVGNIASPELCAASMNRKSLSVALNQGIEGLPVAVLSNSGSRATPRQEPSRKTLTPRHYPAQVRMALHHPRRDHYAEPDLTVEIPDVVEAQITDDAIFESPSSGTWTNCNCLAEEILPSKATEDSVEWMVAVVPVRQPTSCVYFPKIATASGHADAYRDLGASANYLMLGFNRALVLPVSMLAGGAIPTVPVTEL